MDGNISSSGAHDGRAGSVGNQHQTETDRDSSLSRQQQQQQPQESFTTTAAPVDTLGSGNDNTIVQQPMFSQGHAGVANQAAPLFPPAGTGTPVAQFQSPHLDLLSALALPNIQAAATEALAIAANANSGTNPTNPESRSQPPPPPPALPQASAPAHPMRGNVAAAESSIRSPERIQQQNYQTTGAVNANGPPQNLQNFLHDQSYNQQQADPFNQPFFPPAPGSSFLQHPYQLPPFNTLAQTQTSLVGRQSSTLPPSVAPQLQARQQQQHQSQAQAQSPPAPPRAEPTMRQSPYHQPSPAAPPPPPQQQQISSTLLTGIQHLLQQLSTNLSTRGYDSSMVSSAANAVAQQSRSAEPLGQQRQTRISVTDSAPLAPTAAASASLLPALLASISQPQPIPQQSSQETQQHPIQPPIHPGAAAITSQGETSDPTAATAANPTPITAAVVRPSYSTIPCRARGMPSDHNSQSAYFVVPQGIKHGANLICSYPACAAQGVKFCYCVYCGIPVAKRNFRQRHDHGQKRSGKRISSIDIPVSHSGAAVRVPVDSSGGPSSDEQQNSSERDATGEITTTSSEKHKGSIQNIDERKPAAKPSGRGASGAERDGGSGVGGDDDGPSTSTQTHSSHTTSSSDDDKKRKSKRRKKQKRKEKRRRRQERNLVGDEQTSGGKVWRKGDVPAAREQRWARLLYDRPAERNEDAMSQWLMSVMQVSDPATSLPSQSSSSSTGGVDGAPGATGNAAAAATTTNNSNGTGDSTTSTSRSGSSGTTTSSSTSGSTTTSSTTNSHRSTNNTNSPRLSAGSSGNTLTTKSTGSGSQSGSGSTSNNNLGSGSVDLATSHENNDGDGITDHGRSRASRAHDERLSQEEGNREHSSMSSQSATGGATSTTVHHQQPHGSVGGVADIESSDASPTDQQQQQQAANIQDGSRYPSRACATDTGQKRKTLADGDGDGDDHSNDNVDDTDDKDNQGNEQGFDRVSKRLRGERQDDDRDGDEKHDEDDSNGDGDHATDK